MSSIQNIDPTVRDAILSEIATLKSHIEAELAVNRRVIIDRLNDFEHRIATCEAIVNHLDQKLTIDTNFRITKAKLIAIAKELGLE